MKKMFKNTEASNIHEVKVYISTLENHKQQLKKAVNKIKNTVDKK
jgi:flagellar biosynthesis chaperone FliJ